MIQTLLHPSFKSEICAPSSKSQLNRTLIGALLSSEPVRIHYFSALSDDIAAAIACVQALGARVCTKKNTITVFPPESFTDGAVLPCGSSGTALRFFTALCPALGIRAELTCSDELAKRPIQPLIDALTANGAVIKREPDRLTAEKGLSSFDFTVPGHISSQFISGLLFACTVKGGSVKLSSPFESRPYVRMTLDTLRDFGGEAKEKDGAFYVKKCFPFRANSEYTIEGDWSNAAFPLISGILGKKPVSVRGLSRPSAQGDSILPDLLRKAGAEIKEGNGVFTSFPSRLHGTKIDGGDIPDLILPLCIAAACAEGETCITGTERLRYKETDRIESVTELITALGGRINYENGVLKIQGTGLSGGTVNGHNDHRTVMSAALAACVCENAVTVSDAQSVNKSCPDFWDMLENTPDFSEHI